MNCHHLIRKSLLTVAVLATVAGARPSFADETQPKVLLSGTISNRGSLVNGFITEGEYELAQGLVGARLQTLVDGTLTISSPKLPTIVGRWAYNSDWDIMSLWAKTDQIDFNGVVVNLDNNQLALNFFIQVNAPRTDVKAVRETDETNPPPADKLKPASLHLVLSLIPDP